MDPINKTNKRLPLPAWLTLAAVSAAAVVAPPVAGALSTPSAPVAAVTQTANTADCVDPFTIDAELEAETVAELNAEEQKIAEFLTSKGIAFTWQQEDDIKFIQVDSDEGVEAIEEYYRINYGDELAAEDALEAQLQAEDIAEINADEQKLADHLTSKGIAFTWAQDGDIKFVEVDGEAAENAVNEYFDAMYGTHDETGEALPNDISDDEFEIDADDFGDIEADAKAELDAELVAEINADEQKLADHLTSKGIPFTWSQDGDIKFVEVDSETAEKVVEGFFDSLYPDQETGEEDMTVTDECLSADGEDVNLELSLEEFNAEEQKIADYLTSKGIAFTWTQDGDWKYVQVDTDEAHKAIDNYFEENYGE